ncbi:MAG: phosphotransferase enzyme family protein [Gammaproteobacteria bacterium]
MEKLLSAYGHSISAYQVEQHQQGLINQSFRLRSPGNTGLFVQRLNQQAFPEPEALMRNVTRALQQLALTAPGKRETRLRLINSQHGQTLWRDDEGGHWRVFELIENAVAFNQPPSLLIAMQVAHAFADFDRRMADLPAPPLETIIEGFHDTPARQKIFQRTLESGNEEADAETSRLIDQINKHARIATDLMGQTTRPVHNDTKCNNVLFDARNHRPLCVIDLDTVQPGLLAHDYGDMLRSALNPYQENDTGEDEHPLPMDRFQAMARGFIQGLGGRFETAELSGLLAGLPVITYELSLRFLTDHLGGDRYFAVQSPGQNLRRAKRQLRLLETVLANWAKLRDIHEAEIRAAANSPHTAHRTSPTARP